MKTTTNTMVKVSSEQNGRDLEKILRIMMPIVGNMSALRNPPGFLPINDYKNSTNLHIGYLMEEIFLYKNGCVRKSIPTQCKQGCSCVIMNVSIFFRHLLRREKGYFARDTKNGICTFSHTKDEINEVNTFYNTFLNYNLTMTKLFCKHLIQKMVIAEHNLFSSCVFKTITAYTVGQYGKIECPNYIEPEAIKKYVKRENN